MNHTFLLAKMAGAIMALFVAAHAAPSFQPVTPFSLERFLGTWYEIARFPHSFEKGLENVTATYAMRPDGAVSVTNKGMRDGKPTSAVGKAKFASAPDTGHLKVSFFWIFYSDYIIADLDQDYQHALVLSSSTEYLWILSRSPQLAPEVVERLTQKAAGLGFDMSKLIMVKQ